MHFSQEVRYIMGLEEPVNNAYRCAAVLNTKERERANAMHGLGSAFKILGESEGNSEAFSLTGKLGGTAERLASIAADTAENNAFLHDQLGDCIR